MLIVARAKQWGMNHVRESQRGAHARPWLFCCHFMLIHQKPGFGVTLIQGSVRLWFVSPCLYARVFVCSLGVNIWVISKPSHPSPSNLP
jgi:hypothetical protein